MDNSAKIIFQAKNITKTFPGTKALDNVQLTLHEGEVLGLVGENGAGKSTFLKIMIGEHQPDTGEMQFKGKTYNPKSPKDALDVGISMIHQEISLVPTLTVAENIWLGHSGAYMNHGFLNKNKMNEAARKILDSINVKISEKEEVHNLSIANMQLVEIARAISYDSDLVIMDEPTSALTDEETGELFKIIHKLKDEGKSIIFISHKLEEVIEICDSVTAFRDGCYIDTQATSNLTENDMVAMMVGRVLENRFPKIDVQKGETALEVRNFSKAGVFQDISFSVKHGEILGFVGLVGAGRTEIMQALFGIDSYDSGEIIKDGEQISIHNVRQAISHKIAMVTEDRLRSGIIHNLSVSNNIILPSLKKIMTGIFLKNKAEADYVKGAVESLSIKVASVNQPIGSLSGGNQQKAIIGRWLITDPDIYILDEPTRGIDVGAKAEIYRTISDLAAKQKAIIIISSELPEIMGICDRAIVIHDGKISGEFDRSEFSENAIMDKAFGL